MGESEQLCLPVLFPLQETLIVSHMWWHDLQDLYSHVTIWSQLWMFTFPIEMFGCTATLVVQVVVTLVDSCSGFKFVS